MRLSFAGFRRQDHHCLRCPVATRYVLPKAEQLASPLGGSASRGCPKHEKAALSGSWANPQNWAAKIRRIVKRHGETSSGPSSWRSDYWNYLSFWDCLVIKKSELWSCALSWVCRLCVVSCLCGKGSDIKAGGVHVCLVTDSLSGPKATPDRWFGKKQ